MKQLPKILLGLTFGLFLTASIQAQGPLAPEITFENTEGIETTLSSMKGNIVLIDFWASWCRPCRVKHPELVATYQEFKDQPFKQANQFDIFSVSLDKSKTAWLKAIEQDKLEWDNHVSDLKGWQSEVVKTYGIRGIPQNVLLDAEGRIIGRNLHGEQLKKVLQSLQE